MAMLSEPSATPFQRSASGDGAEAPLSRTLRLARPGAGRLALASLLGAGAVGAGIGLIATSAWLISRASQRPQESALTIAIVGVQFFGLSRGLFRYGQRLVAHDVAFRSLAQLRVSSYEHLEALAPAANEGWGHVGPSGAGHFVKMVHNGIEYGIMQAYAEGFSIMRAKTPLHLDLVQISEIWRYGSVVRSWLLDLTADALKKNPTLDGLEAYVPDSGEGRWTVFEAIDLNVSAPVITDALIRRLRSREENNFTDRMLAVMRNEFGGHAVKTAPVGDK